MPENIVMNYPELPYDYLHQIGRIVVSWNRLESLIVHTSIIALIGDFSGDGRALAVFTHMAFPQMLNALEAMLRIIDEDIAKVYCQQVRDPLEKSQSKRNASLHQAWFFEEDGVKRLNIQARKALKITLSLVSIQDLIDSVQFIDETHVELLNLVTVPLVKKLKPQHGQ
jgi:hypothetical protein